MWEIYSNGEIPFTGMTKTEIISMLKQGERLPQPQCDISIFNLMNQCWEKEPTKRYSSAQLNVQDQTE